MERPAPILIPITDELNESNLFKFELQYKSDNIDFSLIDINNSKIKLTANSQIKKGIFKNYSIELTLDYLKKQNKYFKMFDNYQEFRNNFIDICKAKNIKVISIENGELVIAIDLLIICENILYLSLKENELSQKEQIDFLIKDSNDKDKKISELNDLIQIMEKNYNNKISSLEKSINSLIRRIEFLEKERNMKNKSIDKIINEKTVDEKAFLFNIDNLEIYKSKGTEFSINKKNNTIDSINFGGGTDLRIFHNFFSEKNYTSPKENKYFDYKKKKFALNGEKYFEISVFELYRVIIQ